MKNKLKTPNSSAKKGVIANIPEQKQLSSNQMKPLFSFQYLDAAYCVKKCEKNDKVALAEKIQIIGNKTWQELQQAPRKGLGFEKINRNAIKASLPKHLEKDEAINFIAFRFSGNKPMVGYREHEVYHVVWLDRDFTVYNHD
jgi:hypothetical protein